MDLGVVGCIIRRRREQLHQIGNPPRLPSRKEDWKAFKHVQLALHHSLLTGRIRYHLAKEMAEFKDDGSQGDLTIYDQESIDRFERKEWAGLLMIRAKNHEILETHHQFKGVRYLIMIEKGEGSSHHYREQHNKEPARSWAQMQEYLREYARSGVAKRAKVAKRFFAETDATEIEQDPQRTDESSQDTPSLRSEGMMSDWGEESIQVTAAEDEVRARTMVDRMA